MAAELGVGTQGKGGSPGVPEIAPVGVNPVSVLGIVGITAYLIVLSGFLIICLVRFWPPTSATGGGTATVQPVTLLWWTWSPSTEARLFIVVATAGALGGIVHALRSLYWYVGNRALVRSWLVKYIVLPFEGATLGLVFYLVIRGGFFSTQATVDQTSPFGFAGVAGLVGMFSEQAVEKLKEVAATLLKEPPKGENHVSPTPPQPGGETDSSGQG